MSQRFYLPREQVFTNLGAIGAGWKLYTYKTGTTNPKATYSNVALSVANANPIIADSSGRFGDIFVSDLSTYKAILKDSSDNTIWTSDPVDPKTLTLADFDPAPVSFWGTTTGTSTAYELAANPTQSNYTSNSVFYLKFHIACGASPTIDIDDLGILNLKKRDGTGAKIALAENDVLPNYKYAAENDGTDIVILNPNISYILDSYFLNPTLMRKDTLLEGGQINYQLPDINDLVYTDIFKDATNNRYEYRYVTHINSIPTIPFKIVNNSNGTLHQIIDALGDNLSTNGYKVLNNGLIIQWGFGNYNRSFSNETINFPITFPNNCLIVIPSVQLSAADGSNDTWYQLISYNQSSFICYQQNSSSVGTVQARALYLAIGN